ncbi:polysaccharide deacetylase family sporulation protein PdaB [Texcoconibacillus texcoconensis]|uniref:Polysaccharide deacetylase family sporulation protein PdaB n=1 Tax=Texcoconibacillus texcoconensis TaxID=1095777 RepID=A0A840QU81_9BACI|nr:polysaccharide deacetylase family sporulation protein PdaB [Texcoconibacillus texcoconensis]
MNFIWVWKAKNIKRYLIIALAAFFTAGIIYVDQAKIAVFSPSDDDAAIYRADIDEQEVSLTFNISWGEEHAIPILDVLKDHDISNATFFLSGSWAERHPDIVERIVEDGHEIGSHGFHHEHYTKWDDSEIRRDIQLAHDHLVSEIDTEPNYLRPPNGSFDERVLSVARSQNYHIIHWSVDSHDWKEPGVDTIVDNVLEPISPGDIVLFHASDSATQTAEALPTIIEELEKNDYEFLTVSELLAGAESEHSVIE